MKLLIKKIKRVFRKREEPLAVECRIDRHPYVRLGRPEIILTMSLWQSGEKKLISNPVTLEKNSVMHSEAELAQEVFHLMIETINQLLKDWAALHNDS